MFRDDRSLLSGNKLIETLSNENDMFGTIEKAENLISIFRDMHNDIDDIKMIGIYGEWGSGKTTYMNYVCKKLNEIKENESRIYKAISFEAWKYEFDDSLHLSLMEFLSDTSTTVQEDILKDCFLFLKNIALNSKFSLKLPLDISSLEIDTGKALENAIDNKKPLSLYGKLARFKRGYRSLITKILEENNVKRLVVCIDDLDRCEPENVINLLSMIKHFFTYDERIKFICMLDKDAVSKAFLTKYGDVVKSKEYLEKIFDLNFTLNDSEDVSKLIKHYITTDEDAKLVEAFFKNMGILNPRRMIKILNRSLFLERFMFKTGKYKTIIMYNNKEDDNEEKYSFKKNSLFYSFLLYYVIYKEYYPEEFSRMFNLSEKYEELQRNYKIKKSYEGHELPFETTNMPNDPGKWENFVNYNIDGIAFYINGKNEIMMEPDLIIFFVLIPYLKSHSISQPYRQKVEIINASQGIDNNYPHNFMIMYYSENFNPQNGKYNYNTERKFFSVSANTKVYIYKLYKFVKDN